MAAIIFDFDGTIADSFDFVVDLLVESAGLPPLDREHKEALRGHSMAAIGRKLGHSWPRLLWLFFKGRHRMRRHIHGLEPFAGMPQLIKRLHDEGHELFIVTSNTSHNVYAFLRHRGLRPCFSKVYGGTGLFNKTAILRRLLKKHHLTAKECIYIGDELRDVQSAQALGMPVIAVTWGFARPDNLKALHPTAIADTPAGLGQALDQLLQ